MQIRKENIKSILQSKYPTQSQTLIMHLLPGLILLTIFSYATGQNIGPTRGGDKKLNKEDAPSNLNQIESLHFAIAKKKRKGSVRNAK